MPFLCLLAGWPSREWSPQSARVTQTVIGLSSAELGSGVTVANAQQLPLVSSSLVQLDDCLFEY